jgi:hypothetical protein
VKARYMRVHGRYMHGTCEVQASTKPGESAERVGRSPEELETVRGVSVVLAQGFRSHHGGS